MLCPIRPTGVIIVDVAGEEFPATVTWDGWDPKDRETALWTARPDMRVYSGLPVLQLRVALLPPKTSIRVSTE